MKILFKLFFITTLFLFTNSIFGQLDSNNGSKEKGKVKSVVATNAKNVTKPKSIELNGSDGFQRAFDEENKKLQKQQKEANLKNSEILTKAKLNEQRFLKSFKKINGQYIIPKIDQNLGSFRTESKSVNIICRDFQYPDGDKVTIYVNDEPVIYNITLETSYKRFNIPLNVGINKISFVALNQGSSGPNTAAFKVYDDAGMLISANEWNLATGAKATISIAKNK